MNYNDYPPEWKDTIRPAILKRDNYTCQNCGIAHRSRVYKNKSGGYVVCDDFIQEWAKAQGFKVFTLFLQVAHLNHIKSDCRPENLRSLCPKCHGIDRDWETRER